MPAARTTSAQLLGCWHQHLLSRQNGLELAKCCCHWYELMIASQVRFRVVMLATPLLQGEGFAGFMPQQIGQTGAVPTERRHGNAVPQGAKRGQLPHGIYQKHMSRALLSTPCMRYHQSQVAHVMYCLGLGKQNQPLAPSFITASL